ncbi:MAG TPA: hypothetical protein VFP54_08935 [Acidimicrobiales bacterium]|nr:hypothetical protein [Acidimicrobiales bacterium]
MALIPASLDRRVVRAGAGVAIVVAVPAAVAVRVLKSADMAGGHSNWWLAGAAAVLAGFAVGGWFAARRSADLPLSHAAWAAAYGFVVMVIGSALAAVAGSGHVGTATVLVTAALGALCVSFAVLGGWMAVRNDHPVVEGQR